MMIRSGQCRNFEMVNFVRVYNALFLNCMCQHIQFWPITLIIRHTLFLQCIPLVLAIIIYYNYYETHHTNISMQVIPFCCGGTVIPSFDPLHGSDQDHSAVFARSKIWKGRQVLTVSFLNKEFIDEHGGSSVLTVQSIMDWAGVWNSCVSPEDNIPKFEMASFQNSKADIRIKFSSENYVMCMIF